MTRFGIAVLKLCVTRMPFEWRLGTLLSVVSFAIRMRSVKWPLIGFTLGVSLPLLVSCSDWEQRWCSNAGKVRRRIEKVGFSYGRLTEDAFEPFKQCGRAAVPGLIEALKNKNSEVRKSAAHALQYIGAEAKDAIPALAELLKDQDSSVRSSATYALESIGAETKDFIPPNIELLRNEDLRLRHDAARFLGNIGAESKDAIPVLIETLKDPHPDVRSVSAYALGRIVAGLIPSSELDRRVKSPPYGNFNFSPGAITAGWRFIGPEAKDAIPALIPLLKDKEIFVRKKAATALGFIAMSLYKTAENSEQLEAAEKYTLTMKQALQDTDLEVHQQRANDILRKIKAKR